MSRSSLLPLALFGSAALLALAACRHGGESPIVAATTIDTGEGGIYAGTLTSKNQGATYNVYGAIGEGGALQLVNASNQYQYAGQVAVGNTGISGPLRVYDNNGAYVSNASLSGTLTSRSSITGTIFTASSGDTGALNLTYNGTLYGTTPSLATAAGKYRWISTRNNGTSTLTLDSSGIVTGTNEFGCPFTGMASVANVSYDLFNLTLTAANATACGAAAGTTLGGLAYYAPPAGTTPAQLTAAATNATYGFFANYQQQ